MRRVPLFMALVVLAGCGSTVPVATYRAIPDRELYSQIGRVSGVSSVRINWVDRFGDPNAYGGLVRVAPGHGLREVLDHALAILRQGKPDADLSGVMVASEAGGEVSAFDFGLRGPADYLARYGPQPGPGIPPKTPLKRAR